MERLEQAHDTIVSSPAAGHTGGSRFAAVELAPPDAIFNTVTAFKADTDPNKMNLGVGAYRTEEGKPYIFKVVRKVEEEMLADLKLNKEYLAISGDPDFRAVAQRLLMGRDVPEMTTVQSLSGTGALRLGAAFLEKFCPAKLYLPNPTWGNHPAIMEDARLQTDKYPYFDPKTRMLNFEGMISALNTMAPGSIVLLHVCAHNPTGVDPTEEQWKEIAAVMKERALFPFFDNAYQGYATGDLDRDAFAVRYFAEQGFQFVCAQSFAKNMGLYAERVGALHIMTSSKEEAGRVLSQANIIIRRMYSNPPCHGARIVARVLGDKHTFAAWYEELKEVAGRIIKMRSLLCAELENLGTPGSWEHITKQIGMFSFTGLTPAQVDVMIKKYHIYLLKNGRISMAGINTSNVSYLAKAIKASILEAPSA